MNQSEFENLMATAMEAYRSGHPVVEISNEGAEIHGREFLESVRDLEMPLDAAVIGGN